MSKQKIKQPAIELNEQFQRALDIMEHSDKNAFITGRAGTGKSTLLDYFRTTTKKKVVVLAPTGVAALNVKGQTLIAKLVIVLLFMILLPAMVMMLHNESRWPLIWNSS